MPARAHAISDALAAFQSAANASPPPEHEAIPLGAAVCSVALVLVATDPRSWMSRQVDRLTGARGFSHVYLDLCLAVDDRHRVIDYSIANGVHFAAPDVYADRRREWIALPLQSGAEIWACVRARMSRPLRVAPLALGNIEDTCIGLVVACMPAALRAELEPLREGPCLSPNTLARWAGVA